MSSAESAGGISHQIAVIWYHWRNCWIVFSLYVLMSFKAE